MWVNRNKFHQKKVKKVENNIQKENQKLIMKNFLMNSEKIMIIKTILYKNQNKNLTKMWINQNHQIINHKNLLKEQ